MAPIWPQEGPKRAPRAPKSTRRAPQEAHLKAPTGGRYLNPPSFLIDGLQDGPRRRPGGPKRPPRGPQDAPKRPPRGPKTLPEASQTLPEAPGTAKRPPRRPKRPPRGFQDTSQETPRGIQEASGPSARHPLLVRLPLLLLPPHMLMGRVTPSCRGVRPARALGPHALMLSCTCLWGG